MRSSSLLLASLLLAACGGASKPPVGNASSGAHGKIGVTSIRSVDFQNRTYENSDAGAITVVNGEAEVSFGDDMPDVHGWFNVAPPVYGDVDGDGAEDAIVLTAFNGGGTGTFTTGEVYAMREGGPVKIGEIPGGDRGDGGLDDIRIEGSKILVDRNLSTEDDGACCPSKLTKEVWHWDGSAFVEDEAARQTVDNPNFQGE